MTLNELALESIPENSKTTYKLNSVQNALGEHWQIPVMVIKGKPGPVVGVTAALHGNELNGISIIHKLWDKVEPSDLTGTLVLVPVMNIPGFLNGTREFSDQIDLNRIMPGHPEGTSSDVYAHLLMERIVKHFDFLIDLHTASFGRINSLYVRADMGSEVVARMAELQEPEIIVNKSGGKGTLRAEATRLGIHAITVEVGDPHVFQKRHIRSSIFGINNVLVDLGMLDEEKEEIAHSAVVCKDSAWIYAKTGGILRVFPTLIDKVEAGDVIATVVDVFGNIVEKIESPRAGVVVAKATNPVCEVGSRIIHLGTVWDDYEELS